MRNAASVIALKCGEHDRQRSQDVLVRSALLVDGDESRHGAVEAERQIVCAKITSDSTYANEP